MTKFRTDPPDFGPVGDMIVQLAEGRPPFDKIPEPTRRVLHDMLSASKTLSRKVEGLGAQIAGLAHNLAANLPQPPVSAPPMPEEWAIEQRQGRQAPDHSIGPFQEDVLIVDRKGDVWKCGPILGDGCWIASYAPRYPVRSQWIKPLAGHVDRFRRHVPERPPLAELWEERERLIAEYRQRTSLGIGSAVHEHYETLLRTSNFQLAAALDFKCPHCGGEVRPPKP